VERALSIENVLSFLYQLTGQDSVILR